VADAFTEENLRLTYGGRIAFVTRHTNSELVSDRQIAVQAGAAGAAD
jgi:hypothetical protein